MTENQKTVPQEAATERGEQASSPILPPWKTIRLGTGFNDDNGFRQALKSAGCRIVDLATDVAGEQFVLFGVSPAAKEIDLCAATTAELIGGDGTLAEIYAGIGKTGELLPAEAGPQLRLQYPDQPKGECLLLPIEPAGVSAGVFRVFSLGRDNGGLWLYAHYVTPGSVWSAGRRWIFALRK